MAHIAPYLVRGPLGFGPYSWPEDLKLPVEQREPNPVGIPLY